jgi:uncharacterized protein (TIGR02466 family)
MQEKKIYSLFPVPIYFCKLNKNLTKEEINHVNFHKKNIYPNVGNKTSYKNYVLNDKVFKNLKKNLTLIIQDYFKNIVIPEYNITPYITQSWLNFTNINEYHHKHSHPNSLISGVLYIKAHKDFDKIEFYKENESTIEIFSEKINEFNYKSWWFPVETLDVVLFPSYLNHAVLSKKEKNERISLAFNVFVKGTLGNNMNLTELIL